MESRRIEPLPACLMAVAAAALGVSAVLAIGWSEPKEAARLAPPRRSAAPLRWPLQELPPTATPYVAELPLADPAAVLRRFELSPPAPTPSATIAALVTGPFAYPAPKEPSAVRRADAIVLAPRAPLWRAGDGGRRVVSRAERRAWSIGPIDTLAAAQQAGRAWADPTTVQIDRRTLSASLERVRRLVSDAIAGTTPATPQRPAAPIAVAPRIVTPKIVAPKIVEQPIIATIGAYLSGADARGAFPLAAGLSEQLERVAADRDAAPWAWAVAYHLRTLAASGVSEAAAEQALSRLDDAIDEALAEADTHPSDRLATEWRRAAYAVRRRVDAWQAERVQALVAMRMAPAAGLAGSKQRLASARWAMSQEGLGLSPGVVLAEPWSTLRVARRLERYEQQPGSKLAESLAADAQRLAESPADHDRQVGEAIEQNYRNANLRVAVDAELLQRLLPKPEPVQAPVRDRIAGARITGRSVTETEVALRLTPDPAAWRIGLEARGVIDSHTYAHGGPAVLGSRGSVSFVARKLVVVTRDGLRAAPAVADAQTTGSRLVSIATDYDRIPLVGDYARKAARREYAERRHQADTQTRLKVERQAVQTLDERVDSQLADLKARYDEALARRIGALGVKVEPIELRTTDRRLVGRVRVAGEEQLAAHTPRMRAPSDSLLSVQLHESTLNNTLEGLELAGESLTPEALRERIESRLGAPPRREDHEPGVVLRFAEEDAVRVRLADGQAHLVLSLDEIRVRHTRHRDFRVHTYFRPEVDGLTAELVQVGTPEIEGRLRTASRLHLHGVFGKVLGEGGRVPLMRVNDRTPERFAAAMVGLATNQLVIEDGWLGLAIGPQREPGRVAVRVGTYVR